MHRQVPLHVLFTMDCHGTSRRVAGAARPASWSLSARSIESFCDRLRAAGYPATLFVSSSCAEEQAPLMQDLAQRGVEIGLQLNPRDVDRRRYRRYLGHYDRGEQREIVELALERFQQAIGIRPRSVRSSEFSANDHTFPVLHEAGFRQGSVSSPGRRIRKYRADWQGAETDPHHAHPLDRRRTGGLPFLEIPVTTDSNVSRGGVSPEICVDGGTLDDWHRPIAEGQLRRMEGERVPFRALCVYARSAYPYQDETHQCSRNLRHLLGYVDRLAGRYDVVPATISGAHLRFQEARISAGSPQRTSR